MNITIEDYFFPSYTFLEKNEKITLNMTYLKDFQERIDKNDYPGFLKLWEEFCYSDEPDGKEFVQILEAVKNSELATAFGNHIEKGLVLWKLLKEEPISHKVLKLIFDIQTTNSPSLADLGYQYLEQKYPHDPLFNEKLRLIGLRSGEHFEGAISKYELLTHMASGKFVFHKSGWGTCEILDVSMVREEVTLECDLVLGKKHLSFENAFHNLYPLPDDHFLALRFGNPDKLEKIAKEDPCKVIQILLRDLGPKTSLEIKEELFDLVIPEKEWAKWWQAARAKIKKDTKIASPKNSKDAFKLREKAVSHEELFRLAIEKKPSINETIQMMYSFLRDFPETLKNVEFKTSLQARIEEVLAHEELSPDQTVQLYFFLDDINSSRKKELQDLFVKTIKIKELINNIQIISFKKRALVNVKKFRQDWEQVFVDFLPSIEPNTLKDYLFNELLKTKSEKLNGKIKEIIEHPISYPATFVWYFQKGFSGKENLLPSQKREKVKLFENFFVLLSHINNRANLKELGKKMVNLITANRFQIVRDVMETSTIEEAKEYLLLSSKCQLLSDDIKIMHSLAAVVHPSLSNMRKEEAEEEIIWTTQEGYQKVQKRVSEIATVETIENAREIEEAKSFGDLRENAEYKAALEKRDRLQSELKLLSSQLNKAKIITPQDVSTNEVTIGTVVDCQDKTGKRVQFTLLGPWDANPEKHILSFQSKLAKTMIGKKIGDTFTFQNEEFSIEKIYNYFDQK